MNLFSEIYLNSLKETADGYFEQTEAYEPIYLRSFKLLNEYCENPELTPVPKELLIYILKHLKTKTDNVYSITYEEIFSILREHDYDYYSEFKTNLLRFNKYNGNISIAILKYDEEVYHQYLDKIFDFIKIDDLFKKMNESNGITDSLSKDFSLEQLSDKNVLIIIDRDKIKLSQDWKDTLEHEITHFIQRVVGFDKSLKRSMKYLGQNNFSSFSSNIDPFKNNILAKTSLNKSHVESGLNRFIAYLLNPAEHETNIKSCVNFIQRLYEFSFCKFNGNTFKMKNKDTISNRNIWLFDFLQFKDFITLFDSYFLANKNMLNGQDLLKYKKLYAIMIFKIYEILGYDMKKELINHFKTFKFRDI